MIKPAGHRVLVKPDPLDTVSKGGIVLVQDKRSEKAQDTGILVAVGPNAWKGFDDGQPWAQTGDRVCFAQYGGTLIKDGGEDYRILNDEDITAVLIDETASIKAVA